MNRACWLKTVLWLLVLVGAGMAVRAGAANTNRTAEHDYDAPAAGSYTLPVIKAAADGELLDTSGRPQRLLDLTRGRITVMSFIYTRCASPTACPYATGVLLQLHRATAADAELAKHVRLVSLSFDPVNDTPRRMAAYSLVAAQSPAAAPWHFVTTRSQAELDPVLAAYGQVVDKKQNPRDPAGPLNHTMRVFLVDAAGSIRNIYSSGTLDLRLILADVRTLMLESTRSTATAPVSRESPSRSGNANKTE